MKENKEQLVKEAVAVLISSALLGIGVCLELYANIGASSITVFEDGLSRTFGIRIGTASIVYGILMVILDYLFARQYLGWTTIANAVLCGSFINLFDPLLRPLFVTDNLFYRYIILIMSIVVISISCVILIRVKSGMNSIDALAMAVAEKFHFEFSILRIICDGLLILTGYLLGGVVGIGTADSMICTGPMIDLISKAVDMFAR